MYFLSNLAAISLAHSLSSFNCSHSLHHCWHPGYPFTANLSPVPLSPPLLKYGGQIGRWIIPLELRKQDQEGRIRPSCLCCSFKQISFKHFAGYHFYHSWPLRNGQHRFANVCALSSISRLELNLFLFLSKCPPSTASEPPKQWLMLHLENYCKRSQQSYAQ